MNRSVDARLIADLFESHGAALELYARQWTNLADDCVQEALVELARQPRQPENLTAWLYRVVRNRALNAGRAASRRAVHEQTAARLRGGQRSRGADPEEAIALPEAIATLEAEEREVVVLRIWSGLTWQQIAELTNTSSSSAQRRYVAALEQLRKHLEPTCLPNPICRPS